MIDFTEYIEFFDISSFSTWWWELKMINFTEYIVFFQLFGPFAGRKRIDFTGCIGFFLLFDFSTSCWKFKLIGFTEYIGIFRLYDFSNCWWEVKIIDFTIYTYWFFRLFDFSTYCWEVKLIDFTGYIAFFRLFDFWTLEGRGGCRNWPGGEIHGASVRSNIKNTVSVNLKAVCNIQSPEKTKHARTKEWTLLLLTFF